MRACPRIECDAYNYSKRNNCERWAIVAKCPHYEPPQQQKQTTKTETKKMNDFDNANAGTLTTKVNDLTESAKATAKRTGTTIKRVKVGRLAITAIKSALRKTPGVPVYVKQLLDSDYADIIIGAVVPIIVPMITKNAKAITLSEDVAIAGGVAIADKLTFIDDFVAHVMDEVSSKFSVEDDVKAKI